MVKNHMGMKEPPPSLQGEKAAFIPWLSPTIAVSPGQRARKKSLPFAHFAPAQQWSLRSHSLGRNTRLITGLC